MPSIQKPSILTLPLTNFVSLLRTKRITTFHLIYDTNKNTVLASNPLLQPIGEYFAKEGRDWDRHEGIFGQIGPVSGVLQGAFIHRTCRGAGAGGVRNWIYNTVEDWFRDGLRLSLGMTHKNALAQLWWGGGKGLLARNTGVGLQHNAMSEQRRIVFEEFGSFMSSLKGCYNTAEDVGTNEQDMAAIFSKTRFTTCIPPEFGGSGNPSKSTACGVIRGLEAAFEYLGKTLNGASVSVQGAGNVGSWLVTFLLEKQVSCIIVGDVDESNIVSLVKKFPNQVQSGQIIVKVLSPGDYSVLYEDVDAVSPCAVGGILNPTVIPQIKAKIVCGATNNQLADLSRDDKLITKHGIVYVPDFLVNRMGIVNCADEAAGYVDDDPSTELHLGDIHENSIYNLTLAVLKQAAATNRTTHEVAVALAEDRSFEPHPIWGHRGIKIIESLVKSQEWALRVAENDPANS